MGEKLTIRFELINEFGEEFSQSSSVGVHQDVGGSDLDVIGGNLNVFLKQCGYYRKHDNIFMGSVSDEEYDAIDAFLEKYRQDKEEAES